VQIRNSKSQIRNCPAGFTLIEIVLVTLLIAVLASILIPALHQGFEGYANLETRGDLISQARDAAGRMIREVRSIQKEADNTPNITTANASSLTFVDVQGTTISFSLSSGTVQRNTDDLVDNVSTLQFRYFNGSNSELTSLPLSAADRDNVRRIMLTLTLGERDQTVSVTEQAYLRELAGY
jgi:prepilin-type N-terminal cleavage/methylation domain-containing protein